SACALSHDRASGLYNRTVPRTHIVSRDHSISNVGIPMDRIVAATHRAVQKIVIHASATSRAASTRPERLSSDGRTLEVFRPQPAPTARPGALVAGQPQPGVGTTPIRALGNNQRLPLLPESAATA